MTPIPKIIIRIYNAVAKSHAMKHRLQVMSTLKGPVLYDMDTGKPLLGASGEALDDRFIKKRKKTC